MPNDGERYFTRVEIGLQGAFADAEPAAYGFIVEPFVLFGRIADELFDTMHKVCKVGAGPLPCFAVDNNEFHCILFVLITLLLLGKQTHIQSVATIVVCKGKRRTTLNKATQKSKEIEGREEKLVCQSEKLLSFRQKALKLLAKSL